MSTPVLRSRLDKLFHRIETSTLDEVLGLDADRVIAFDNAGRFRRYRERIVWSCFGEARIATFETLEAADWFMQLIKDHGVQEFGWEEETD